MLGLEKQTFFAYKFAHTLVLLLKFVWGPVYFPQFITIKTMQTTKQILFKPFALQFNIVVNFTHGFVMPAPKGLKNSARLAARNKRHVGLVNYS